MFQNGVWENMHQARNKMHVELRKHPVKKSNWPTERSNQFLKRYDSVQIKQQRVHKKVNFFLWQFPYYLLYLGLEYNENINK